MDFVNLPIFILLIAFVYLSIVYGLLKIVETHQQSENIENIISDNLPKTGQEVETS